MKNILVLSSFTREQLDSCLFDAVRETWAKSILDWTSDDGCECGCPHFRFYAYAAMSDDERLQSPHDTLGRIDVENSLVLCPYPDDLFSSFNRTLCAMRTLVQHI